MDRAPHNTVAASAEWYYTTGLTVRHFIGDCFSVAPEQRKWFGPAPNAAETKSSIPSAIYLDGMIEDFHPRSRLDHLVNEGLTIKHPDLPGRDCGFVSVRFVCMASIKDRNCISESVTFVAPRKKLGMAAVRKRLRTLASEAILCQS